MRPTKATIRTDALRHNLEVARQCAPPSREIAVIKANAYGHGAVETARALSSRADAFAVALLEEAIELRDAGIDHPILVLQGANSAEDTLEAAQRDLWLMLHEPRQIEWILASREATVFTAWLKVDTGMHRLGLGQQRAEKAIADLQASGRLAEPPVLCTHLACADDPDHEMTQRQVTDFRAWAEPMGLPMSIANSAGVLYWPLSHADWNRPGYMLYGHSPSSASGLAPESLRPVMTLESELIAVREVPEGGSAGYGQRWLAKRPSRIGTVAIGYADGYPRHAPDGTPVWVRDQRVPLVGTVSMDMVTVDVTDVENAKPGDRVELWGENLPVNEVAACAGTIGYELLSGLTARVPRIYRQ